MENYEIDPTLTVSQVLDRWPQTAAVFMEHRMACVGCDITAFETLAEAVTIYHLELPAFLAELSQAISPS